MIDKNLKRERVCLLGLERVKVIVRVRKVGNNRAGEGKSTTSYEYAVRAVFVGAGQE